MCLTALQPIHLRLAHFITSMNCKLLPMVWLAPCRRGFPPLKHHTLSYAVWHRNKYKTRVTTFLKRRKSARGFIAMVRFHTALRCFLCQSCNTMAIHQLGRACSLPVRNAGYNAQPKRKEVKRGAGWSDSTVDTV